MLQQKQFYTLSHFKIDPPVQVDALNLNQQIDAEAAKIKKFACIQIQRLQLGEAGRNQFFKQFLYMELMTNKPLNATNKTVKLPLHLWKFMTKIELMVALFGTGIFTMLLALFYRFGKNQERIDNSFKCIDDKFKNLDDRFKTIDDKFKNIDDKFKNIDDRFDRIEARLVKIELSINSLDSRIHSLEGRILTIENKLNRMDERFNSMDTRVAVIETRLTDIGTNVSHLMWHNQSLPHKEAQEE
ncbi:MAG: hypothetical protein LW832_09085 [Parachlamydia sp.]|jgi:septation ring formation regulator EzrA|nr:hypothetical protein [Parachlamydia sp.]